MKVARISGFILCLLLLGSTVKAGITPISQTLDYTDNYNVYLSPESDPNRIVFVKPWATIDNSDPDDPDIIDHWPWYRHELQCWGWTHDLSGRIPADANGIASATLVIDGWDVNSDAEPPEIDNIFANNTLLGALDGTSIYEWGTTTFDLPSSVLNELWTDGEAYIYIDIDTINDATGHRVTLGSSTLTVNYTVSGAGRGAVKPVFRFWSPSLGHHFYTTSETERDDVIHYFSADWSDYEGPAYYLPIDEGEPGLAPVYRFWSDLYQGHFYTISETEKNDVLATWPDVWQLEGVAFYAYPVGQQPSDAKAVYRFWSDQYLSHFYTIDENERDYIIATWPTAWTYEYIAWYAYQ